MIDSLELTEEVDSTHAITPLDVPPENLEQEHACELAVGGFEGLVPSPLGGETQDMEIEMDIDEEGTGGSWEEERGHGEALNGACALRRHIYRAEPPFSPFRIPQLYHA